MEAGIITNTVSGVPDYHDTIMVHPPNPILSKASKPYTLGQLRASRFGTQACHNVASTDLNC